MRKMIGVGLAGIALTAAAQAEAFCGFYVGGADKKLFNNATEVVLMRDGTRTVLSMANNYQGPPSSFAMVVPVPVVLQKENVKTLTKDVFEHVDRLGAPRLVEYWEQDPCWRPSPPRMLGAGGPSKPSARPDMAEAKAKDLGVTIEAKFTVGEYDIVILSAKDSGGLDTWLRDEHYTIPDGANVYLDPYVKAGSKFFVAKVDVTKVKFADGMAQLSPLRFHYDADTFSLPIRLGLMNSKGTQDLIVTILARQKRYEVANYPNVTIPTNLDVAEGARAQFGAFYAALFDRTLEKNPKAIVTEYSWDATSCDPCPSPPLAPSELQVLGADVLAKPDMGDPLGGMGGPFTMTRLHARYAKESLGEDLVFRAAGPITGGREMRTGKDGTLEQGAVAATYNNFQGRYAIRHPWTGPIACEAPIRGRWGGPPEGTKPADIRPAMNTAFAPRGGLQLATLVKGSLPDAVALPGDVKPLGSPVVPVVPVTATVAPTASAAPSATLTATASASAPTADAAAEAPPAPRSSCGCEVVARPSAFAPLAGLVLALVAIARRRR